MTTTVDFFHGPTQRDFPARCADLSLGGMRMYVPAAAPVQPGQPIRLALASLPPLELSRLGGQTLEGTIVRVDRTSFLRDGHVTVGVRFALA